MERQPIQIHIIEPDAVRDFYKTVFGWDVLQKDESNGSWKINRYGITITQVPEHGEAIKLVERVESHHASEGVVDTYLACFHVSNVAHVVGMVEQEGGLLFVEASPPDGLNGGTTLCLDPKGNLFGLIEKTEFRYGVSENVA